MLVSLGPRPRAHRVVAPPPTPHPLLHLPAFLTRSCPPRRRRRGRHRHLFSLPGCVANRCLPTFVKQYGCLRTNIIPTISLPADDAELYRKLSVHIASLMHLLSKPLGTMIVRVAVSASFVDAAETGNRHSSYSLHAPS
ncbi:hypothetical protein R3P38DRAFT_3178770 [Favolaschia claudopus]|uniref:Uncharacterized protein n=1 Tax=Favolaschia claudopus TaxID=2862362 RepID=A0AAW0CT29_9AGAR